MFLAEVNPLICWLDHLESPSVAGVGLIPTRSRSQLKQIIPSMVKFHEKSHEITMKSQFFLRICLPPQQQSSASQKALPGPAGIRGARGPPRRPPVTLKTPAAPGKFPARI